MFFYAAGCSTHKPEVPPGSETVSSDDAYMRRPRLNKPQGRPLGRVQISWTEVPDVDGYEIQMSENESFTHVLKKWTIQGKRLEVPIESGTVVWFRIRAFNSITSSRWSVVLRVEEQKL